jgi:hypothetical protein
LTFTLDGHAPEAALIQELQHDVIAWRWDDTVGADRPVFRGVIGQSEDQLTTEKHVVTFTCHDYLAMMGRRINQTFLSWTATDQDTIAAVLLQTAGPGAGSTGGGYGSFAPGSYLPLAAAFVNPDGTTRGPSGVLRDRTYPAQSVLGTLLDNLAKVIGGFDYDVLPLGAPDHESDALRIFYPAQGVTRTAPVLEYGGLVATVTRSVNSADYANYVRYLGNNGSADPAAAQVYGEAFNADAAGVGVGLWSLPANAADVAVGLTLTQQAQGDLSRYGVLTPTYSLGLTPNAYYAGMFNMGDTLPLVILSGRLKVNTNVRVVGLSYAIGDDGNEDVGVTVGRPLPTLADLFRRANNDIDALARR